MHSVMGIIPAAGLGLRMRSDEEKPFIAIGGRSILAHTLSVFEACPAVEGYVLVVEPSRVASCRALLAGPSRLAEPGEPDDPAEAGDPGGSGGPGDLGVPGGASSDAFPKLAEVVAGGSTRQESVYRGLMALDEDTASVLIHDAARPCVEQGALEASVQGGARHGAVISATPSTDTMKIIRDGVVEATADRSSLWRAQTPQTFAYGILRTAHERAREEGYVGTDDAELVERAGYVVRVLEGSPDNIKVTTAEDLEIAERILRRQGRI